MAVSIRYGKVWRGSAVPDPNKMYWTVWCHAKLEGKHVDLGEVHYKEWTEAFDQAVLWAVAEGKPIEYGRWGKNVIKKVDEYCKLRPGADQWFKRMLVTDKTKDIGSSLDELAKEVPFVLAGGNGQFTWGLPVVSAGGHAADVGAAFKALVDAVATHYPGTEFAKWRAGS